MKLFDHFFLRIKFPHTLYAILKNLSVQRAFLETNIQPLIFEAQLYNDGSLEASDIKKITGYYGLAVPAILGEAFCALHGKKMSFRERLASTSQGSMTGLFDDFFDKQNMPDHSVENMLGDDSFSSKRSNEKLFIHFYKCALQHVPKKNKMEQALRDVYHAQVESKKQLHSLISQKEIEDITFNKGGVSVLFYRTAFLPHPSEDEQEVLYNLGALMQLANDIFDVYKDRENGVRTLVTETLYINNIRQLLKERLESCFRQAYSIGSKYKNVRIFLSIISLGIFSRAFVCLDQLQKNEFATNGKFQVHKYSRAELICDMDTRKNMVRSAGYYLQLMANS